MIRKMLVALSAAAMAAAPVAASAAPAANPAASLSLAPAARAGTPSAHHDKLLGGPVLIALIVLGGIGAIVGVAASGQGDHSASN